MSTSRQIRVELCPAEPVDFVDIEVRPDEAADWFGMLERPEFLDLLPTLRPVTFRRKDTGRPAVIVGLGAIKTAVPGLVLPWVWAAFDRATVREWGRLRSALEVRNNLPAVRRWLDDHASGFYTSPQAAGKDEKAFTKLLDFVGFHNLGYGLWQWRA
jgi:hypothetical protein